MAQCRGRALAAAKRTAAHAHVALSLQVHVAHHHAATRGLHSVGVVVGEMGPAAK
jgi:hypothetical protein